MGTLVRFPGKVRHGAGNCFYRVRDCHVSPDRAWALERQSRDLKPDWLKSGNAAARHRILRRICPRAEGHPPADLTRSKAGIFGSAPIEEKGDPSFEMAATFLKGADADE